MVTHIPSSRSSTSSFPFSNPFKKNSSRSHRQSRSSSSQASTAPYTSSAASSSTTINASNPRYRPPPLSYNNHRRAPSTSSNHSDSNSSTNTSHRPPSPSISTTSTSITTPSSYYGVTPRPPPSAAASAARYRASEYPPPSSLASTSTAHRSHSRGQRPSSRHSSQRGTRYQAEAPAAVQNTFPWFGVSGDVEILLCPRGHRPGTSRTERRYLLHRLILAQNSGFWEGEFGDVTVDSRANDPATTLSQLTDSNSQVRDGSGRRWTYHLDWNNSGEVIDGKLPVLIAADYAAMNTHGPPSMRNKPPPPPSGVFRDRAANSSTTQLESHGNRDDEDTILAYDNLFRIFYNHPPQLDTSHIAEAYVQCKILLSLASTYGALNVVGPRVEHHLLGFHGNLWRQVAKYSASYLKLGYLARSRAIFSEALTHVVGQWPLSRDQLRRGAVEDRVVELIEDKVDELEDFMMRAELKLSRISLTTSRGERVNPTNAYLDWLAVSLFRQWMAENMAPAPTGILKTGSQGGRGSEVDRSTAVKQPNKGRIFRIIGAGGEAYLQHDELKRFLKMTPEHYSRDRLRRFEKRAEELKNLAKEVVKPVTRNCLELDSGDSSRGDLAYLTCIKCDDRDFAFVWASEG